MMTYRECHARMRRGAERSVQSTLIRNVRKSVDVRNTWRPHHFFIFFSLSFFILFYFFTFFNFFPLFLFFFTFSLFFHFFNFFIF